MNINDITYLTEMFIRFKIEHFTPREILNGRDVPDNLLQNIIPTVKVLNDLREKYGYPIYINSTYRDKDYNKAVGGKKNSLHLEFNAIDFTVKNQKDLKSLYEILDKWDKTEGLFQTILPKPKGNFGLGLYPNFIHLDTRSILNRRSPARW
jgi:uncharacterized protein YcbK (DUF882 family)